MTNKLELLKSSHSVHQLGIHLVWCTKYRHSVLRNGIDVTVKRTIGETCKVYGWKCCAIEIMPDHIHLFIQVNHTDSPCVVAKTLKSITAVTVFNLYPHIKQQKFWGSGLWSDGTFYSSVGQISQETIIKYIETQKQR